MPSEAAAMETNEHNVLVKDYLDAVDAIEAAVAGMTGEHAVARPQPGKWSALELVCHVVDMDLLSVVRINLILSSDQPSLPVATADQLRGSPCVDARSIGNEVAFLRTLRFHTAELLSSLRPHAFHRTGVIRRGTDVRTRTLEQLVRGITDHIYHHLRFLREKRQLLGLA
jgi:hypothetical protein